MIAGLSFIGLLILGAPIAFVLLACAIVLAVEGGNAILLQGLPQQLFAGIESYGLLSLPLFILLGELMAVGGIGRRLLGLAAALLPPLRAGLAQVNLLTNVMLATVLGSTVAQLAVMSRLAVPEMEKAGYPRDLSATITAAGGLLAPLIPPSMNLIVFATIAQFPVADLFNMAMIPGLITGLAFCAVVAWLGRRHGLPRDPGLPPKARLGALIGALPSLVVPAVAIGTIVAGIATPTEAAALASLAAMVVGGLIHREITLTDLVRAFRRTAITSGAVLYLVAAAQLIGWVMTFGNLPAQVAGLIQTVATSPLMFLILVNVALLLLGTVLEPIPGIILTVPVLLPVATGVYGIDPAIFGVIVCLNLSLGLLTPPVGAGLYAAAMMTGVSAGRLSRLLTPFFVAALVVLAGLTVVAATSSF